MKCSPESHRTLGESLGSTVLGQGWEDAGVHPGDCEGTGVEQEGPEESCRDAGEATCANRGLSKWCCHCNSLTLAVNMAMGLVGKMLKGRRTNFWGEDGQGEGHTVLWVPAFPATPHSLHACLQAWPPLTP